jgi:hypothetical protein
MSNNTGVASSCRHPQIPNTNPGAGNVLPELLPVHKLATIKANTVELTLVSSTWCMNSILHMKNYVCIKFMYSGNKRVSP